MSDNDLEIVPGEDELYEEQDSGDMPNGIPFIVGNEAAERFQLLWDEIHSRCFYDRTPAELCG